MNENSIILTTSPVKIIPTVGQFDKETIEVAKRMFREQIERGVIKGGSFEDDVWYTTDEYSNLSLRFDFNKFTYRTWFKDVFKSSIVVFTEYVKAYILFLFGKIVLRSMQGMLADLRRILKTPPEELYGLNTDLNITHTHLLEEFFSFFPGSEENERINELLAVLDEYAYIQMQPTGNARQLAQFESYFLFHDIICDFWKNCKDEETKLFYYPLYLWWQLTAVIPTRPKEFIVTQRNCLEHTENGYYLTLQKTCLKGGKKIVGYKISADYRPVTYKIPNELGHCIENYLTETEKYDSTKLNTLFVADTHYRKWKQKKNKRSRYLTYVNLSTIMRYFYAEIISGKYGLKVIYEHRNGHLEDGTIERINLGDARHLALINLMQQGGTPMLAMFLAGHDNEIMSCHYWSNIKTMVECQTYRQYRLVTGNKINYQVSHTQLALKPKQDGVLLQDGCKCFSSAYQSGDMSDCREAIGPEGEIGFCPSCSYHRKSNSNYWGSALIYERRIEDSCRELNEAVKLVRKQKGNGEEIGEALLRLKDVSFSYARYLEEVKNEEDSIHGPKKNY